jgi:cytoskeletal protein CcmA (bactofilin family)
MVANLPAKEFSNPEEEPMADAGSPEFPTILGPDATFKGELTFEKGMRLMGRVEGKIQSPGRLHVAREAKVQADVEAGSIIVEGDVKGNLVASDRIELKQTARYEGDLRATKLTVDEGAIFSGHVSVGPDSVKNRPPTNAATPAAAARPGPLPSAVPQGQAVK